MRESVNADCSESALARILAAFEQELLAASDEEILAAAKELGMNPAMKGSAAFLGLRFLRRASPDWYLDGFDPALLARLGLRGPRQSADRTAQPPLPTPRQPRRARPPRRPVDK
jgi:hypothetical protein